MQCPRCQTEMEISTHSDVEIDRCPKCGGVFLDKGEMESISERAVASVVDMHPSFEQVEAESPAICRCGQEMMEITGADEVRFDWCMSCESTFFDAGELRQIDAFSAE